MTKEFFLDYEELKSLREANKRQSRIIDDLLRDKVNLIEKKNSLAESVMSLTDLNSEIAEKCEGMMSEQDAKTLAICSLQPWALNWGTSLHTRLRKLVG
jgi:hypothetical protein